MMCPKCGKALPESAKFCDSCGSAVTGKKEQKKPLWKTVVISIAAIAVGTLIGKAAGTMLATSFYDQPEQVNNDLYIQAMEADDTSVRQPVITTEPERKNDLFIQAMEGNRSPGTAESTARENDLFIQAMEGKGNSRQSNPTGASGKAAERTDYDKVFDIRGIKDVSGISSELSSIAAVRCYDAGGVECVEKQEFGCKNGIVVEMEWSYYYKTEGYGQAQIDALDQTMRAYFGEALADVACCSLDYRKLSNFYCIQLAFTDLNDLSNMKAMLKGMESLGSAIIADEYDMSYIPAPSASEFINNGYFVKES